MIIFLLSILCISLAFSAIMLLLMVVFLLKYNKNKNTKSIDIIVDKEIVNNFFEKHAIEKYVCNNLITFAAISDELDGCIVYDFSMFEENGNVGLIYYFSEKRLKQTFNLDINFEDEESMDEEEALIANYKNQTIYLLKDGSYQWDISQFL